MTTSVQPVGHRPGTFIVRPYGHRWGVFNTLGKAPITVKARKGQAKVVASVLAGWSGRVLVEGE